MLQPSVNAEIMACLQAVFLEVEWNLDELVSFYKTIGIMNPGGKPYVEREKKLYEVIHFSSHVTMCIENISRVRETTLLDCGCGRSYLPFFVNIVLKKKRRNITYIGVDANAKLIEKSSQTAKALDYANMKIYQSSIIDFEPGRKINIV